MRKILFILLAIVLVIFNFFLVKDSIKSLVKGDKSKQNTASVFDVVQGNLNFK